MTTATNIVLDASAILAVARNESGCETVKAARTTAILSAVNHMEVVSKLLQHDLSFEEIHRFLAEAFPSVIPFSEQQANLAAQLHAKHRRDNVSYGDAACLALAQHRNLPVLTGDRKWTAIPVSVEVRLFR